MGVHACMILICMAFMKRPQKALYGRIYTLSRRFVFVKPFQTLVDTLSASDQQEIACAARLFDLELPSKYVRRPLRYDAHVYAVSVCDGLLRLIGDGKSPVQRFLRICQKLPLELIELITVGKPVPAASFEIAFATYMRHF